jgi:hypothetical protein
MTAGTPLSASTARMVKEYYAARYGGLMNRGIDPVLALRIRA